MGEKEINQIKDDLKNYVVISEDERKRMMVSLVGGGSRLAHVALPDGGNIKLSCGNFMTAEFFWEDENSEISHQVLLAPRPWLETMQPLNK